MPTGTRHSLGADSFLAPHTAPGSHEHLIDAGLGGPPGPALPSMTPLRVFRPTPLLPEDSTLVQQHVLKCAPVGETAAELPGFTKGKKKPRHPALVLGVQTITQPRPRVSPEETCHTSDLSFLRPFQSWSTRSGPLTRQLQASRADPARLTSPHFQASVTICLCYLSLPQPGMYLPSSSQGSHPSPAASPDHSTSHSPVCLPTWTHPVGTAGLHRGAPPSDPEAQHRGPTQASASLWE